MEQEFRFSGKKMTLAYPVSSENKEVIFAIHSKLQSIGRIEKFMMVLEDEQITFNVQFYAKLNFRALDRFYVKVGEEEYKPEVKSLKRFPEGNDVLTDEIILSRVLTAMSDLDSPEFISLLKSQPEYIILKRLKLSEYHIISFIICALFEPGLHEQAERIQSVVKKISSLPYINTISGYLIEDSISKLNKEQMQEIIYILKGIH